MIIAETLSHYDCCLANTIMQAPVILAASQIQLTNVWVIHEAWPKDQIEYYCKQVFLMEHLDTQVIMEAFRKADKIVFPAKVQENCYEGLFEPPKASVIYNGKQTYIYIYIKYNTILSRHSTHCNQCFPCYTIQKQNTCRTWILFQRYSVTSYGNSL